MMELLNSVQCEEVSSAPLECKEAVSCFLHTRKQGHHSLVENEPIPNGECGDSK